MPHFQEPVAVGSCSLEQLEQRTLLNAVNIIPSVEGVTAGSVYVSLETTDTATATVDFGLTASYGSTATTETAQSTGSSYFQNIKLTGLAANTQYHYRVRQGTSTTADYTFWTAPGIDYTGSVRWAFAADSRTNTTDHNNVVAHILPYNPPMTVYGGDLPNSGTYSDWTNQWLVANQRSLNAVSPWVNALGNHEGWNSTTVAFTQSPEGDGVGGNGYFSFDYGPAHIVVINVQTSYAQGSAQWNWVAADLSSPATQAQPWKIVVAHYPPYTYGGSHSSDPTMQAMTTQLFEPNHVDMTLTGHNHFYQHNLVNGIHHMVIGSFGAPLVAPGNDPSYTVYSEETYCFGIFDMTRGQLTLKTYRGLQNTLIETITLTKDVVAPVVTVTPKATNDTTPSLAGTVDDPTATISVTVGGHTYSAVNNGNGTWTLPDNTISPALTRGAYNVQVTGRDAAGNVGADATTGELTVYTVMGDANLDGEVGPEDFGLLKDNFGLDGLTNAWSLGDFNSDGEIGPEDFGILKDNFGLTEPLQTAPLTGTSPIAASASAATEPPTDATGTPSRASWPRWTSRFPSGPEGPITA
ncbi:MAG: metallophosphoesterase [Planctomycetota bacterium]|nr:metallophosphoesterase [Planctomycetota bacterium]